MKRHRQVFEALLLAAMLLGLPLLGCLLAGNPLGQYLEFPPRTRYVEHAPFSWVVFIGLSCFIILVLYKFAARALEKTGSSIATEKDTFHPFPWWGWAGIFLTGTSWVVAWCRFEFVGAVQGHTFTPLWIGYILSVNAVCHWRTGRSLLTHETGFYLALFPVSAVFWWFFEYLNRFVQNWYYVAHTHDSWSYFWSATLPFSTVLPAVLATDQLIKSSSWPGNKFKNFKSIRIRRPRLFSAVVFCVSALGLSGIGVFPNVLFPLLWVSPLLLLVSLKGLFGERHIFSPVSQGNWVDIVSAGSAALICGFFWEMWNIGSMNKWFYEIPYVHGFEIFEMPLLGYAGYLPFGLECVVVSIFFGRLLGFDAKINEIERYDK